MVITFSVIYDTETDKVAVKYEGPGIEPTTAQVDAGCDAAIYAIANSSLTINGGDFVGAS